MATYGEIGSLYDVANESGGTTNYANRLASANVILAGTEAECQ